MATHDFWKDGDTEDFLQVDGKWALKGAYPINDKNGNMLPMDGRIEKAVSTCGTEVLTVRVKACEVQAGDSVYRAGHGIVVRHDGRSKIRWSYTAGVDGQPSRYPSGDKEYSFGIMHPNSFVQKVTSIGEAS